MLLKEEVQELEGLNKNVEKVKKQLKQLLNGFPEIEIIAPARLANGITKLSEKELKNYIRQYEVENLEVVKFVPASGAATRMFKSLQEAINTKKETKEVVNFIANLTKFSFAEKIPKQLESLNKVAFLLEENGLNYANLPKGVISFHTRNGESKTPFEEQLLEGCFYALKNKQVNLHFTISKNHLSTIKKIIDHEVEFLQQKYNCKIGVKYSEQKKSTDTVAITSEGKLVKKDGEILFRPAGHGALIQNLNKINADLIYVKNIDNVVKKALLEDTVNYKKALGGILIELQKEIYNLLNLLLEKPTEETLKKAEQFIENRLGVLLDKSANNIETKIRNVYRYLNRPIRVAGMVKNTGEPGGGPFWVKDKQFGKSLQIIEEVQIKKEKTDQLTHFNNSTHFNPVDIVCGVKNHKGKKFDLMQFVDENAGLIAQKSVDGNAIKVLELPGLWNGAMANWITVFVEVPITTFNPVKTVFDLLKLEHQE